MAGLFKKVIWVWPSWDEETHEADDISQIFGNGIVVTGKNGDRQFCDCHFAKDGKTKTECQFVNRTLFSRNEDYDGSKIDVKHCDVKQSGIHQEIVDYNALNKLVLGQLVAQGDSLLLDIDEDFFGCVLRGQSLVDKNMPWNEVEEIDSLLNELICPQLTAHEELGNRFMQLLLALVVKHCKSSKEDAVACVDPKTRKGKAFTSEVNRVANSYLNKGIFCETSITEQQKRLEMLLEYFIHLSVEQIRACAELGFCMQTSPRSYHANGFQLCHGANEPNTTIVTTHLPGENELYLRLKRLHRMLHAGKYPRPRMVTLCRSVRDGYTPVEYFKNIEKTVIESILSSRDDVTFNVTYDVNLLGGKRGWPARKNDVYIRKKEKKR